VRVQIDNREFTVTGAIDSQTARHIDAAEARARRIIVDGGTGPTSPARIRSPTSPTRGLQSPGGRDAAPGNSPRYDVDEDGDDYEYYLVEVTGEKIPLLQAIDAGWVFIKYDNNDEQAPDVQVNIHLRHRCNVAHK